MTKAQKYIDQYYPPQQRSTEKKLDLRNKFLEGPLDLTSFYNLEELDCSNNNITDLKLCSNELRYLDCSSNNLQNLDLTRLNTSKLTYLRISNNKLSRRYLSIFSDFVNLEVLIIGSDINTKNNNFIGSLQPLQYLSHLRELDISNTNIESGLDYLPTSLVSIRCYNDKKNNGSISSSIIVDALKPYNFQITKWRQAHDPNYVDARVQLQEKEEKIRKLEKELEEYKQVLSQFSEQLGEKETQEVGAQTTEAGMEEENQQEAQVEVITENHSS